MVADRLSRKVGILSREIVTMSETLDDGGVRPIVAPLGHADLEKARLGVEVERREHHPGSQRDIGGQKDPGPSVCSGNARLNE